MCFKCDHMKSDDSVFALQILLISATKLMPYYQKNFSFSDRWLKLKTPFLLSNCFECFVDPGFLFDVPTVTIKVNRLERTSFLF